MDPGTSQNGLPLYPKTLVSPVTVLAYRLVLYRKESFYFFKLFFMCIGVLFVSLYIRCVSNSHGGQKNLWRALEPLELELPLDAVNLT